MTEPRCQRLALTWLVLSLLLARGSAALGQGAGEPAAAQLAERTAAWMEAYAALPADDRVAGLRTFTPGYFERVELRTETDEFDVARQRYALRVTPLLPHVRRAERALQEALRAELATLDAESRADAFGDALQLLFELATDARELALLDTLRAVQTQLVDVARRRLAEPGYDVENALDAEVDLADLELRQGELRALAADVEAPVPLERIVDFAQVRERLERLAAGGPEPDPGDDPRAELAVIEAEAALERAENNRWLDFLQLEYIDGRGDRVDGPLFNQRARIGGGIQFPRRARNVRDLHELEIERLEVQREADLDARERRRAFDDDVAELRRAIAQHEALRSRLAERAATRERLLAAYLRSTQTRPEAILRLRRRGLRDRLELLQIEEDIREGYAELVADYTTLDAAGIARWVLR